MAGGTGGHVFPALAVAAELRARGHGVEWLGTRAGIEAELVPANGIALYCIQVAGVRGKGLAAKALAPLQILRALWQALAVVRRVRPAVVLGFGGFASGPGGMAARLMGIPLVIHEQNAVAGTTNRILARVATQVAEAFPGTLAGAAHTGNPVRAEIAALPAPAARQLGSHRPARLLVLGGSLGATAINERVPAALALLPSGARPEVRHQCGRKHVEATAAAYRAAGVEASVEPFIADMAEAYGWADFVVCRAGALTVAELTAAGVGALLVPFPAAIDDHQTRNGRWLVDNGAALLVPQGELTPEHLAALLGELLGDGDRLLTLAEHSRALARTTAARDVAALCENLMARGATA
jgi:UDP-N-acetylglucosamine--N-acetylmuramyl-(pentapeptide) pyrophosphoryl-undecaprenol N-acetylglucosamine transferase